MERRNYHTDSRVRAEDARKRRDEYVTIYEEQKEALLEVSGMEVLVPIRWEVCPQCDGDGSVVNPSIDAGGISQQEMARKGPEFREDYLSGKYDQKCPQCKGRRVTPELDPRNQEQREAVEALRERLEEAREVDRMRRAEKAMGA
jgi:hypothetical protein